MIFAVFPAPGQYSIAPPYGWFYASPITIGRYTILSNITVHMPLYYERRDRDDIFDSK